MSDPNDTEPVIVPLGEVARVFTSNESAIADQAGQEESPESALALAAIGRTLRAIQDAPPEEDEARVMTTVHNGPVSRLQSMIASGENADSDFVSIPHGGREAKFDTRDILGWASVAWARIRNPKNHPLLKATSTAEPFTNKGRVAILGDWGTGLYGAPVMARTIASDAEDYAMLMHLGDVYYSGTANEVQKRFLDIWPSRSEAIHRSANSNHEMYSGGHSYFGKTLAQFNQKASYFAHQNDHWTLVGLDVAYKDHDIDDEQVNWLQGIIAAAEDRKIILFSHHQLFSHYESQGTKLWAHSKFKRILSSGKIFAWYWGHEHRCCIFEEPHADTGILARCIGHGGMPQSRKKTWDLPAATAAGADKWADWRRASATSRNKIAVPQSLILEGTNEYMGDEAKKFLPHGYAVLNFDDKSLTEQVMNPAGDVIYEKELS